MNEKVYLAVPIIANRDPEKAYNIGQILTALGYSVISKWVIQTDPGYSMSPRQVFERDANGVKESDILLAEVSEGSHGVGMEIMLAHIHNKKIICIYRKGRNVSRMLMGLPNAIFLEYTSQEDMDEKLRKIFAKV